MIRKETDQMKTSVRNRDGAYRSIDCSRKPTGVFA